MGYTPDGIQGNINQMSRKEKELKIVEKYLIDHPECQMYEGMTLEEVRRDLESIDHFEHLN